MSAQLRAHLDEINWQNDARNCERDEAPVLYLADGTEKALPTTWIVCSVCRGAGSHVSPSIDCSGLSAEDFDEDPDFAESYMGGDYDVTCNRCGGRTTERAVDWDRLSEADASAYRAQLHDEARDRAVEMAERRAGA